MALIYPHPLFMRKFERSPFSPKILSFTSIPISRRFDAKSLCDTLRDSLRDGKARAIALASVIMKIYKSFFLSRKATPNFSQLRTMTSILSLQRGNGFSIPQASKKQNPQLLKEVRDFNSSLLSVNPGQECNTTTDDKRDS
jgi:hypothetical protein